MGIKRAASLTLGTESSRIDTKRTDTAGTTRGQRNKRASGKMFCFDDVTSGRRPFINEREYAQLKGCSVYKLQRDRYLGKGIPFHKDQDTGRILYSAENILADLQGTVHHSTSEYDTTSHVKRLSAARKAKQVRLDTAV